MPPANVLYTRASYSSCGCFALIDSNLMATSSPLTMLVPNSQVDPWYINKVKRSVTANLYEVHNNAQGEGTFHARLERTQRNNAR